MDMNTTEPLRGEKLLKTVVNQILAHPETWYQGNWHCGTKHCIAGWCQILSGKPQNSDSAASDAQEALGISDTDASFLFRSSCTISEAYYFAANFNCDGFNRAGYDRAGFNCDGFNCDGFNRAGYDRAGYDRAGYDRAGFYRSGYDRAGFNCDGFNRAGKKLEPFGL